MRQRIQNYAAAFLGLSVEETWKQRVDRMHLYGTCLEWLMADKGFTDVEDYLAAVHPIDEADALPPDPALRKFLEGIPIPKAILTNSPREHVDRVLGKLGFEGLFTHIFDVRMCGFLGKPHPDFFSNALNILGASIDTVLFIDDVPRYVEGFIHMGGTGILFDEKNQYSDFPHPRIRHLEELTAYLDG